MSIKQDLTHTRTAAQLEQKYSFGKRFAEIIGLIDDSRDRVDSVESTLSSEIREQATSLTRSTEEIVMSAMENYETISDAERHRQELKSELSTTAENIAMSFDALLEDQIEDVNGDLQTVVQNLEKHFVFDATGLTIKAGANEMKLRIDNNVIAFYSGEIDESDLSKNRLGYWDGDYFHTGNIVIKVNERAQFGNFAFIPRSNGSLSFLKVGG